MLAAVLPAVSPSVSHLRARFHLRLFFLRTSGLLPFGFDQARPGRPSISSFRPCLLFYFLFFLDAPFTIFIFFVAHF